MKTINSYKHLKRITSNQINAQDLLNGRLNLKKTGLSDIRLKPEFKEIVISDIIYSLGGWAKTKRSMYLSLKHSTPQHWGLGRMIVGHYQERSYISYCAGQDYISECAEIRRYLSK